MNTRLNVVVVGYFLLFLVLHVTVLIRWWGREVETVIRVNERGSNAFVPIMMKITG